MHEAVSLEWKHEAACRGRPDADTLFWPPSSDRRGIGAMDEAADWRVDKRPLALALCATCPVVVECGAYAEANGEEAGVWGGVDFGERFNRARTAGRRSRPRDSEAMRNRIAFWYGRGLRPSAIARRLDITVRTVHRCLRAGDAS